MKNVTYLFPDIQKELINIIGKVLILNSIISEIFLDHGWWSDST